MELDEKDPKDTQVIDEEETEQPEKKEKKPVKENEEPEEEETKEEESEEESEDEEGLGELDGEESSSATDKKLDAVLNEIRKLAGNKDSKESNDDKTWTLAELRQVERRIDNGELDPKYKAWVAEKRSEIIARQIASETEARVGFSGSWAGSMARAKKDFPDLKNPKSALFKEAKALVLADPNYQAYVRATATNPKTDPSKFNLDPDLQYKCAERAYARVQRQKSAQPKSKVTAKDGLEGGKSTDTSQTKIGREQLDRLEAQAVKTGSQSDWKRYFTAREKSLRAAKK